MYSILKLKTDYTFLESTLRIDKLCKKLKKNGCKAAAITEKNNLYSAVKFYKKCKELDIKPILGVSIDIEIDKGYVVCLAKNLQGWKTLIKIVSKLSETPFITINDIAELSNNNLIVYGGSLGSHLTKVAFENYKLSIKHNTKLDGFYSDFSERIIKNIELYKKLFGENFYIELEKFENDKNQSALALYNFVKNLDCGVKKFANFSPYYFDVEDAEDQRILLCSKEQISLENVQKKIEISENYDLLRFFKHSEYYLLSPEKLSELHDKQEIEVIDEIVSKIEDYEILSNPKIPNFKCPDGFDSNSYIKHLCDIAWKEKISCLPIEKHETYKNRLNEELETFLPIGLAPYFLILWDIVDWGKKQGWIITARGSAGGCLVSYLLGITESDPVEYNLLFSRFYSKWRNRPGKINFPDIDIDVPTSKREEIIEYVINKYGKDNVAHISTFSELQGKSILKDVLRAKQRCSYAEMNIITECIIDKAKVSDKLEEIRKQAEEQGEDIDASLIEWALDHETKLSEWCRKDENGNLVGDYAKDFEQAMRLEWTKRQIGVHAAGLVVSDEPIQNFCPTTINKDGRLTVTWDKYDTEAVGGMKMDLLGLACHDDIMETIRIINEADYYVDSD